MTFDNDTKLEYKNLFIIASKKHFFASVIIVI